MSDFDKMRVLPHNDEAERAVLGALLLSNERLDDVSEFLQPIHFASELNGKIYRSIIALSGLGIVADPITLKKYFVDAADEQVANNTGYLVSLVNSVISTTNIYDYARIIYDMYIRRKLIAVSEDIAHRALTFEELSPKGKDQINMAEEDLYNLANSGTVGGELQPFSGALLDTVGLLSNAYKNKGKLTGITTGLKGVDEKLGGLNKSDLIIIAGRPGMGKTALAANIALNAAIAKVKGNPSGGSVALFSLEMSKEQVITRIISQQCSISTEALRRGEITEEQYALVKKQNEVLANLPIHIDDTPCVSAMDIKRKARRVKRKYGLDLIIIDYLQLMQAAKGRSAIDSRNYEITDMTRSLKILARELDVAVVVLSQLSRAVETRECKRPLLSDLRDSGSIEQDADIVMFVYREAYYELAKKPATSSRAYLDWVERMKGIYNKSELVIAKHRNGSTGIVNLGFDGKYTMFYDIDM